MNKNYQLFYNSSKGFTLLELLFVVAITLTLMAISQRPYTRQIQRQDIAKITRHFESSLDYARQTAAVSGRVITICPLDDITSTSAQVCVAWERLDATTQNKKTGWIIFHDRNNDGQWQTTETVYTKVPFNSNKSAIEWTRGTTRIRVFPRGSTGDTGTLRVYTPNLGSLTAWNSHNPPAIKKTIHETRVALTALGKVSVRE